MKVGDLVKVKEGAVLLDGAYRGHIGIIFEIREKRNEVFILINGRSISFLPRHLEVINEGR